MADHLYLCELEGENLRVPGEPGRWQKNSRQIIDEISNGIRVDTDAVTRGVSSVPDIWSRPLMFQSALRSDSKHPLKNRFIQEWRGLLSLLALHSVLDYEMEIVPLNLEKETDNFSIALRKLAPRPIQLQQGIDYNWLDIVLIKFKDPKTRKLYPLGAFSPATLVFTGAAYQKALKSTDMIFHDAEGFLCPPVPVRHLAEIAQLKVWLTSLIERLNNPQSDAFLFSDQRENPVHWPIVLRINQMLNSWLEDINADLEGSAFGAQNQIVLAEEPIQTGVGADYLHKYKVYQALLYTMKKKDEAGGTRKTDYALAMTRNRSGYKEVIVIAEELLQNNGIIWDHRTLSHLGNDVKICLNRHFTESFGTKIEQANLLDEHVMWIRPEKYFLTDVLLTSKNHAPIVAKDATAAPADDMNERRSNVASRYILPFTRHILDYFSPAEIQQDLKPEFHEDGDQVHFSFEIPWRDRNDNTRKLKLRKTYRLKSGAEGFGTINEINIPVLELYPKHLDPAWRRYYLFQGSAEAFTVNPVLPEGNLTEVSLIDTLDKVGEKIRIVEITGNEAYPDGVTIGSIDDKTSFGLILLKSPGEQGYQMRTWYVGIDFGASNTNIYALDHEKGAPDQLTFNFNKNIYHITNSNPDKRRALLNNYFVPDKEIKLPIPTALKIFPYVKQANLFLNYFLYLTDEYIIPKNVYANLKWDSEDDTKRKGFLTALLFQIIVEALAENPQAKTINVRCSYPKAFPPDFIAQYERAISQIIENFRTELIHGDTITISVDTFETEGVCAGHFFSEDRTMQGSYKAYKQNAAICIDVGGSTTDISIWCTDKIVFDASILLAGQQIARLLQKNKKLNSLIFNDSEALQALDEKRDDMSLFAATLNKVLRRSDAQIPDQLLKYANNRSIKWIQQLIALEFCAISYYTGLTFIALSKHWEQIVKQLELRNQYETDQLLEIDLLEKIKHEKMTMHWGGNAAKLVNWLDLGIYFKDKIASNMTRAAFFNCLGCINIKPREIIYCQSPRPKSEAAGGLVVLPLREKDEQTSSSSIKLDMNPGDMAGLAMEMTSEDQNSTVNNVSLTDKRFFASGEKIELKNSRMLVASDLISSRIMYENNISLFKQTTLENLRHFISIFNHFGTKWNFFTEDSKIVLTDEIAGIIKEEIFAHFIKGQSLKDAKRLIEPIFITEVKVLLEQLEKRIPV